jgi:release factor glutamine methyltransferase
MATKKINWTVLDILNATTEYFTRNNFEQPRLNAERLLSHILDLDRVNLYLQFERILTVGEIGSYRDLVKRRSQHEPLQYIIGKAEFMGLPFDLNREVLIPRPETEILVEATLALKDELLHNDVHIWDIGTGSGCIAISMAYHWPDCQVLATDNSGSALEIAQSNARLNEVNNIIFKKHDVFNDPFHWDYNIDIVVSNPPYISDNEYADLDKEIIEFEPIQALTDHKDGLEFYRRILTLIDELNGCKFVLLEMSGTQTDKIFSLVKSCGYNETEIINDLNQIPRVLKISI